MIFNVTKCIQFMEITNFFWSRSLEVECKIWSNKKVVSYMQSTQRSYQIWLDKINYKTEMKFWAVLGSQGCRKILPTAIIYNFLGGFFNFKDILSLSSCTMYTPHLKYRNGFFNAHQRHQCNEFYLI